MAEILTESFCERCGSRYTFESAVPRARMRGVKVLSRGLKNFVLDDKTSIDEAMAAARDDTDRALTSHQLEAFHKTFNFCMQCRQYICPNCWNDADGRCLTCAPLVGHGMAPALLPHLDPSAGTLGADDGLAAAAMNGPAHSADETNGFDPLARLDAFAVDATPPLPEPEMVGASEVEARAEAAVELAAAAAEPIAAEAAAPPEADAPVIDDQAAAPEHAFRTDAIDLEREPTVEAAAPEIASGPDTIDLGPEPTIEGEAAPADDAVPTFDSLAARESLPIEPDVDPEPVAAASDAGGATPDGDAATQDVAAGLDAAAVVETDETRDRRVSAAQATLLLAGLKPGQSLDEAIAAFESEPTVAAEPEQVEAAQAEAPPVEVEHVEAEAVIATEAVEVVAVAEAVEPIAEAAESDDLSAVPDAPLVMDAVEVAEAQPLVEPLVAAAIAEAARPEPAAHAEPLDEIPTAEALVADVPVEPEDTWHPEPLVDLAPAEPVDLERVLVETVAIEPAVTEPAVTEAAPEPAGPEPDEIAAAVAAVDLVDQPTWSIVAPAPATLDGVPGPIADPAIEPPAVPVVPPTQAEPSPTEEPSWPAQPQWPSAQPSSGLAFLGRPMIPTGGVDALWAESDRAVSAPRAGTDKPAGGVQPCVSCGLSLSASARFCRRCGTSQAG